MFNPFLKLYDKFVPLDKRLRRAKLRYSALQSEWDKLQPKKSFTAKKKNPVKFEKAWNKKANYKTAEKAVKAEVLCDENLLKVSNEGQGRLELRTKNFVPVRNVTSPLMLKEQESPSGFPKVEKPVLVNVPAIKKANSNVLKSLSKLDKVYDEKTIK